MRKSDIKSRLSLLSENLQDQLWKEGQDSAFGLRREKAFLRGMEFVPGYQVFSGFLTSL